MTDEERNDRKTSGLPEERPTARCAFCHCSEDWVDDLLRSPDATPTYICDRCVAVCASILEDRRKERERKEDQKTAGSFPSETKEGAASVFYSYSHRDEDLRNKLEEHLSVLRWQRLIRNWHDRKIPAGGAWESEINEQLENADIVLLLISSSFLASDYCYGREMKRALERHAAGDCQVIPVIVRPADWMHSPFAKLKALPRDGKPVTTWNNREQAFLDIARGIRSAIVERRQTVAQHRD